MKNIDILKGKVLALEEQRAKIQKDILECDKLMKLGQAQTFAYKKSIDSIETLHDHIEKDDSLDDSSKNLTHNWVDRSRQLVESLLHPMDRDVKMNLGIVSYLQSSLVNISDLITSYENEIKLLELSLIKKENKEDVIGPKKPSKKDLKAKEE
jgi:hypothetical protein